MSSALRQVPHPHTMIVRCARMQICCRGSNPPWGLPVSDAPTLKMHICKYKEDSLPNVQLTSGKKLKVSAAILSWNICSKPPSMHSFKIINSNYHHRSITWLWFYPVASFHISICCFTVHGTFLSTPFVRFALMQLFNWLVFCFSFLLPYRHCGRDRFWHLCMVFARVGIFIQPSMSWLSIFRGIVCLFQGCFQSFNYHLVTITSAHLPHVTVTQPVSNV